MPEKAKQRKPWRWGKIWVSPELLRSRLAEKLSGEEPPADTFPLLQAFDGIKSEETARDFIVAVRMATKLSEIGFPLSDPYAFDVAESEKAAADFIAKREKMQNPNPADRRLLMLRMAAQLSGVTLEKAVANFILVAFEMAAQLSGTRVPTSPPLLKNSEKPVKIAAEIIARLENMHNQNLVTRRLLVFRMAAQLSGKEKLATSLPHLQAFDEIINLLQAFGVKKSEEAAADFIVAFEMAAQWSRIGFSASDPLLLQAFGVKRSEKAAADFIARWERWGENMEVPHLVDRRLLVLRIAAQLNGVTLEMAAADFIVAFEMAAHWSGFNVPKTDPFLLQAFKVLKSEKAVADFIMTLEIAAQLRGIRFPRRLLVFRMAAQLCGVTPARAAQLHRATIFPWLLGTA